MSSIGIATMGKFDGPGLGRGGGGGGPIAIQEKRKPEIFIKEIIYGEDIEKKITLIVEEPIPS